MRSSVNGYKARVWVRTRLVAIARLLGLVGTGQAATGDDEPVDEPKDSAFGRSVGLRKLPPECEELEDVVVRSVPGDWTGTEIDTLMEAVQAHRDVSRVGCVQRSLGERVHAGGDPCDDGVYEGTRERSGGVFDDEHQLLGVLRRALP